MAVNNSINSKQGLAPTDAPSFTGVTLSTTPLAPASGGTGVNNSTNTITLIDGDLKIASDNATNLAIGSPSPILTGTVRNTSFGSPALNSNTTGNFNCAFGSVALGANTTGLANNAFGQGASGSGTTASSNCAFGQAALSLNNGDLNCAYGNSSGSLYSYTNCTFLGTFADTTVTGLTNATAIGYNAKVAASNCMVLGQVGTFIGIGITTPTAEFHVVGSSILGTVIGGAWAADPIAILYGGTGQTTQTAAFDALAPTTTTGDIIYHNGTDNVRLAIGTAGQELTVVAGAPAWATPSGANATVEVTGTSQAMAVDTDYIANNAALVTLTLPATAALGSTIVVMGKGVGGWLIAQNASQLINLGSSPTTIGVAGSLASTNTFDCLTLTCITADTTWVAYGVEGNITVV